jgi:hypothetical protein
MLRPPMAAQAMRLARLWRNTTSSLCPRAVLQRPLHAHHHAESTTVRPLSTLHEARNEHEPEPGASARAGQLRQQNTMTRPPCARLKPHTARHAASATPVMICANHGLLHLIVAPTRRHHMIAQLLPCRPPWSRTPPSTPSSGRQPAARSVFELVCGPLK